MFHLPCKGSLIASFCFFAKFEGSHALSWEDLLCSSFS
ncbi:hypothetical protein ZOSMA_401G00070 [Zostera marina]|uniref:Uncharacterized protein n=1 Tax=Zostera marina TaxID=29655 RepID=A0A0K9P3E1_ZOSMR|nr:hypothetical protein ZOSMA_401G00070 [Zostera marina]